MDSQKSAVDNINAFDRSCSSCSILSYTTFGVSNGRCAKDIVDKFMVQLKERKDMELEQNKRAIEVGGILRIFTCNILLFNLFQELLANLNLQKAREVQAAPDTDQLKTELAIAHKTISDFEMAFW
jgi:hypothetical protein